MNFEKQTTSLRRIVTSEEFLTKQQDRNLIRQNMQL